MNEAQLTDYYAASGEYRTMLEAQERSYFAVYLSFFERYVPHRSRVLDVGCGVGATTRLLREAGFDAQGTDPSARFLPDEEGFFVADFCRPTGIPAGTYQAAGANAVLEHVPDPRTFLDELMRVVAPGGHVVIASPNLTSPLVGLRVLLDLRQGRTPYLGLRRKREALALIARNLVRSVAAAAGRNAFSPRADTLATGIVGHDVDAIYWTNAAEVRRYFERAGCRIVRYQGYGRTRAARLVARLLPSFASGLIIVARTPG